jgi:hypothetical protein
MLPEKKFYFSEESREMLINIVRKYYPNAMAEGACGSYSFYVGSRLVAEAWIHPRKPGWWMRIKDYD